MSVASLNADTPLSSLQGDTEAVERVSEILVNMGYAVISSGNIRLTEAGEAQKNA
jgi:hypothetical protein